MSSESPGGSRSPAEDPATKTPEELQRDIEQSREALGDTVDALSSKTDVSARFRRATDERKAKLQAKRDEWTAKLPGGSSDGPDGGGGGGGPDAAEHARRAASGLAEQTRRQPLAYLAGIQ
jgi:hypothetical protein